MRVCIPTEDKAGLSARVHGHFGSARHFTIYDTEKKTVEILDNTNAHHSHGMCHPLGVLGPAGIDVVVCLGMGARAVTNLNASGIRAFMASGDTVSEILKRYDAGELSEITSQNACARHGCH